MILTKGPVTSELTTQSKDDGVKILNIRDDSFLIIPKSMPSSSNKGLSPLKCPVKADRISQIP